MFNVKKKLDELINECKITAVGSGYTELICPIDNIEKFINGVTSLNINIIYWDYWCKVTPEHLPCGSGGPKNKYEEDCWYSELMPTTYIFNKNDELLKYLLNDWKNDENYKECYVPSFYLKVPKRWKNNCN